MDLKSLHCPNCGADLEVEDGLDTFFCKYCGHKILLEGQSKAAYDAKVRIKEMEHEEKLQDKRDAQERYKLRDLNITTFICILIVILVSAVVIVFINSVSSSSEAEEKQREQDLQTIVDQIMIDIDTENFSDAYIKANSLYWGKSYPAESKDKWDNIRKEIINQIERAEEKATGTITHSQKENVDENKDNEKDENDEEKEDILDEILNLFD